MLNSEFPTEAGLTYIAMLCSNQSSLEGKFSYQPRTVHDSGTTYSGGITDKSKKQYMAPLAPGKSYFSEDCLHAVHDTSAPAIGSALFIKHFKEADSELEKLKELRQKCKHQDGDTPSRFGCKELGLGTAVELCQRKAMKILQHR